MLLRSGTIVAALLLAVSPVATAAQSTGELQARLQALLAQIAEIQKQITGQQGGTPEGAVVTSSSSTPSSSSAAIQATMNPAVACVVLSRNLFLDADDTTTNGEVTKLQRFLAQDSEIYPESRITGYFGPATQRAVQRWQAREGIVSSGDPDTTGFGYVGPKTRAALRERCGGSPALTGSAPVEQSVSSESSSATASPSNPLPGFAPSSATYAEAAYYAPISNNVSINGAPGQSITYDHDLSFTTPTPTLVGTATGLESVGVRLTAYVIQSGAPVRLVLAYHNPSVPVINGRWIVTIPKELPKSAYAVTVYGPNRKPVLSYGINVDSTVPASVLATFAAPKGAITEFISDPPTVTSVDQNMTLSWKSVDTTGCSIYISHPSSSTKYTVAGGLPSSGSVTLSRASAAAGTPVANVIWTLNQFNLLCITVEGGEIGKSVTITEQEQKETSYAQSSYYAQSTYSTNAESVPSYSQGSYVRESDTFAVTSLSAAPTSMPSNGSVTLSWTSVGASSCQLYVADTLADRGRLRVASGLPVSGSRATSNAEASSVLGEQNALPLSFVIECLNTAGQAVSKVILVPVSSANTYSQATYYSQGSYESAYTQASYYAQSSYNNPTPSDTSSGVTTYWVKPGHEAAVCNHFTQASAYTVVETRDARCEGSRCVDPSFYWMVGTTLITEQRPSYLPADGIIPRIQCGAGGAMQGDTYLNTAAAATVSSTLRQLASALQALLSILAR